MVHFQDLTYFWIILIVAYAGFLLYFGLRPSSGKFLDRLSYSPRNKKGKTNLLSVTKYILTGIFLFASFFLLLPIGIIGMMRNHERRLNPVREIISREKPGFLYHRNMGGCGIITCKECGLREDIVSFLHGTGKRHGSRTGYQCQRCGRHVDLYSDDLTKPGFTCECGGKLKSHKPLFCSSCRSKDLSYHLEYLT